MDLNCPIWSKEGHPFGIMSFTSFLEEWQRKNMISPVRSFTKGQQQHLPGGLKCYLAQPDYEGISEVSFPPIIDIWSQLWLKILAKNACPKTTDVSQNNWSRGMSLSNVDISNSCVIAGSERVCSFDLRKSLTNTELAHPIELLSDTTK